MQDEENRHLRIAGEPGDGMAATPGLTILRRQIMEVERLYGPSQVISLIPGNPAEMLELLRLTVADEPSASLLPTVNVLVRDPQNAGTTGPIGLPFRLQHLEVVHESQPEVWLFSGPTYERERVEVLFTDGKLASVSLIGRAVDGEQTVETLQ